MADTDTHMIRLDNTTYEKLRVYAFEQRLSFGKAIAKLLADDPRASKDRAQDATADAIA
jgi:hypothetical protein